MKKILAFTLAEVLVATAIVGIVSALTVPNISRTYKQKVYASKAAKAEHILNNAMAAAIQKYGSVPQMINGKTTDADLSKRLLSVLSDYMKVTMTCNSGSSTNACFKPGSISYPGSNPVNSIISDVGMSSFTPAYEKNASYNISSLHGKVYNSNPGNNSDCAAAILETGISIAICGKLDKYNASTDTNGAVVAGVWISFVDPKSSEDLVMKQNSVFGYLTDAGFVEGYGTITAMKKGEFARGSNLPQTVVNLSNVTQPTLTRVPVISGF